MLHHKHLIVLFATLLALLVPVSIVTAQGPTSRPGTRAPKVSAGTAFTYQGQLKQNGVPVNATCDFQFRLWDSASGGNGIGVSNIPQTLPVTNGLFSTTLDFGANAFNGDARWLSISVACPSGSLYVPMATRQPLTPVPIAVSLPGLATFQNGNGAQLTASGYGFVQTDGTISAGTYVGGGGGWFGTQSNHPLYFFTNNNTPQVTLLQNGNLGIGTTSPASPLDIYTTSSGYGLVQRNAIGIGVGTYVGSGAKGELGGWLGTTSNHPLYLFTKGSGAQITLAPSGNVGIGTISPGYKLEVVGDTFLNGAVTLGGSVYIGYLAQGGVQQICIDTNGGSGNIAHCSSSIRYKNNVADLNLGLDAIAKLRPVTFDWKKDGSHDLGFIAEEVSQVTPLLTTLNENGQIEGVKYDRITAILVKGIQEQQQQIADLKAQNTAQQNEITQLKQDNADIKARLATLEQTVQVNNVGAHSDSTGNIAVIVVGGLLGIIVTQKPWRRGER